MMTKTNIDDRSVSEKVLKLTCAIGLAAVLSACGKSSSDGDEVTSIALPTDSSLKLYCEDAGIADNPCILDDPENPYALTDVNNDNKFAFNDAAPSAKARFYLWGTLQAMSPSGENQYYTALNLKTMWEETGKTSDLAKEHSLRAFRSVIDNYYNGFTFFECFAGDDECPLTGTYQEPIRVLIYPQDDGK